MSSDNSFVCPEGSLRYVWRQGDTLKGVAMAFNTTVSAMIEVNPDVDFAKLTAGTSICVPLRSLTCPNADLYAIQKGDTLYDLARSYGVSTETMMELNPYVEPTKLSIGQVICVPRKAAAQEPETPPEPDAPEQPFAPDDRPPMMGLKPCAASDYVRCGQTLYDILAKYGLTYAEFTALNPRLAHRPLLPGQKYNYPLRACACGNGRYTLKDADTPSSVAAAAGISASELMRRNPHLKPDDFKPGTEICLTYSEK